jgi:hypothetical protein
VKADEPSGAGDENAHCQSCRRGGSEEQCIA